MDRQAPVSPARWASPRSALTHRHHVRGRQKAELIRLIGSICRIEPDAPAKPLAEGHDDH